MEESAKNFRTSLFNLKRKIEAGMAELEGEEPKSTEKQVEQAFQSGWDDCSDKRDVVQFVNAKLLLEEIKALRETMKKNPKLDKDSGYKLSLIESNLSCLFYSILKDMKRHSFQDDSVWAEFDRMKEEKGEKE